jgi:NAD(P)-dependent dehydrogenase (short-subunit alcohol dehydrogenase family)
MSTKRYPKLDLRGAVVVITGGARGIGLETGRAFAAAGARVVLADLDGEEAATAASGMGGDAVAAAVDVRDPGSVAELAERAGRLGPTAVLVNNAGIMPVGRFLDEDPALTSQQLDVNVLGPIHGMRAFLPAMVERGRGHVVNVASMAGKVPVPGLATYNATKFAVVGLSGAVRRELARTGVSITAVLPSAVRTGLVAGIPAIPGLPYVDPDDVAAAIVRSCATRRAQVHGPRAIGAWDLVSAILPSGLIDRVRSRMGEEDFVQRVDDEARAAYADRRRRQERRVRP